MNDPPSVVDSKINGNLNQTIYFKNVDFTQNFIDVDNDQLEKIKIMTIPNHGTLKLDGKTVRIFQEIPSISLEKLRFEPEAKWFG